MKLSLFPLLAISSVLGLSPAFAIGGGPVYDPPTGDALQTGTYQAILRGQNMMGIVIFGSVAAPSTASIPGQGLSALYFDGYTMYGDCFGTASSTTKNVAATFEASLVRTGQVTVTSQLNPNQTITFNVNDVVNGSGSLNATFDSSQSANFSGSGTVTFSLVNGLDVYPADPYVATQDVSFTVYGLRSSFTAPVFGTIPTVETPTVVATGATNP